MTQSEQSDIATIAIQVRMRRRWVPHFLGMLKAMERYGSIGASRQVAIYSDGDGDFNPKFEWSDACPEPAEPVTDDDGNLLFDAG